MFNPFSNLTALTENQATPSVPITMKRNPMMLRKPFIKVPFFLDLLDLLQQQQKHIPMTRLNMNCYFSKIINKSAPLFPPEKSKEKAKGDTDNHWSVLLDYIGIVVDNQIENILECLDVLLKELRRQQLRLDDGLEEEIGDVEQNLHCSLVLIVTHGPVGHLGKFLTD